jgi:hypothetical protein
MLGPATSDDAEGSQLNIMGHAHAPFRYAPVVLKSLRHPSLDTFDVSTVYPFRTPQNSLSCVT